MNKKKKFLSTAFLLLSAFLTIQIGYYFYLKLTTAKKPLGRSFRNEQGKRSGEIKNNLKEVEGKDYLLSLIPAAKQKQDEYISGTSFIQKVEPRSKCYLTKACLEFENRENTWYGKTNKKSHLPIKGGFVVRLTMIGDDGLSGINFYGRVNPIGSLWWEETKSLFIGLKKSGDILYVDARDGTSPDPIKLLEKKMAKKPSFLNIFFDRQGKHILIADEKYQPIEYLDVNKITNNKFPEGTFPDGRLYLGFTVAPQSFVTILEFSIAFLNS